VRQQNAGELIREQAMALMAMLNREQPTTEYEHHLARELERYFLACRIAQPAEPRWYCPRCDGFDAAHSEDCPKHPENYG
jgi:hypothetical protein